MPRCAREDVFGHASAGGSTVAELAAESVEGDRVASRKVGEPGFDGGERRWIGEDLCGVFERLVRPGDYLVDTHATPELVAAA